MVFERQIEAHVTGHTYVIEGELYKMKYVSKSRIEELKASCQKKL